RIDILDQGPIPPGRPRDRTSAGRGLRRSDERPEKALVPSSWIQTAYGTSINTKMGTLTTLRGTAMQIMASAHTTTSQNSATPPMNRGLISGTGWVSSFTIIVTGGIERPAPRTRISQRIGPPRFIPERATNRPVGTGRGEGLRCGRLSCPKLPSARHRPVHGPKRNGSSLYSQHSASPYVFTHSGR